jgi:hypothetical protein
MDAGHISNFSSFFNKNFETWLQAFLEISCMGKDHMQDNHNGESEIYTI